MKEEHGLERTRLPNLECLKCEFAFLRKIARGIVLDVYHHGDFIAMHHEKETSYATWVVGFEISGEHFAIVD